MIKKHINEEINEQYLNHLINRCVRQGYRVVSQTPTSAQLVMEKKFSCLIASLLFLFFAIPFFIYLFWYLAKREETLYLRLEQRNDQQVIRITNHRGRERLYTTRLPKVSTNPKKLGPDKVKTTKRKMPVWLIIIIVLASLAIFLIIVGVLAGL